MPNTKKPASIQIIVDHPCASFSGERTFRISESPEGFSASCIGFGSSRFYATPIAAALALIADNGGSEAVR